MFTRRIDGIAINILGKKVYRAGKNALEVLNVNSTANFSESKIDNKDSKKYINIYLSKKRYLTEILKSDITSRQCILSFWKYNEKYPVCITQIQFIYDKNLKAIAYWRSSDIRKFKDDIKIVSFILADLSKTLGIKHSKKINCFFGSLHKYA